MINRVIITGRLTRDVEVKKTQSGLSVASYSVAVDRPKKKDEQNSTADFINCVTWRQPADYLANYGRKGGMIALEGRLQTRTYDKPDGTKAYIVEVLTDNVQLIREGSREQNASAPAQTNQQYGMGYEQNQTYGMGYRQEQGSQADFTSDPGFDISNDDLPF